jgi:ATP citrate (pro-S)-lyase
MFTSEVQFGHAGSHADSDRETAIAKNRALREAGAYVPNSFDELGDLIQYDSSSFYFECVNYSTCYYD